MSEQTFRTNETELTAEEIDEVSSEEDTEVTKEPTLREKVFKVCDTFKTEGKKITRDTIRPITGGSDRDLSKYLKEWKRSMNNNQNKDDNEERGEGTLVIQSSTNIEVQSHGETVQVEEEVQTIKTRTLKRHVKVTAGAVINGANRVANELVTEEQAYQYLMENPDQLPLELKQEVEKAMSESDRIRNERAVKFETSFFIEEVIASLSGKS